jgi:hypothetical protein
MGTPFQETRRSQAWADGLAGEGRGYVITVLYPHKGERRECGECGQRKPLPTRGRYEVEDERKNKTRLALHMQDRAATMYEEARDDYEWAIEQGA